MPKRKLIPLLLLAALLATPGNAVGQSDGITGQLEAIREKQKQYLQQQGGLLKDAEQTQQGLADIQAQVAKQRVEVESAAKELDLVNQRLTVLKRQRGLAMHESYVGGRDASFVYALADSRSVSDFLNRGQYTQFLLKEKATVVDEIAKTVAELDRARQDLLTKKNALEVEIASLDRRAAEIRAALAENRSNQDAARNLESYLAGLTGNYSRNERDFTKRNEIVGDLVTFEGGGTEHGLGMSQYGAKGMAQRGSNYRDIIGHYYQGSAVGSVGSFQTNQGESEAYLVGVVEAEMNSNWPMESLKAQAVAARSYAYRNRSSLDNTPRTQAWVGPSLQTANARRAVAETRGQVVTYGGEVVQAFFHSTSGGHTENNENVWGGTPLPWLRGVPSPGETDSPHWTWRTRGYSKAEMGAILAKDARTAVGDLRSIKITGRGVGGRVTSVQITGSAGTKTVSGPRFKAIFNTHSPANDPLLRSTLFGFV